MPVVPSHRHQCREHDDPCAHFNSKWEGKKAPGVAAHALPMHGDLAAMNPHSPDDALISATAAAIQM